MALKKIVTMSNGLPLEYHRIALVTIEPNQRMTILYHSYLNEEARQYEKDYEAGLIKGQPQFPYVAYEYVHMDYAENIDAMNGEPMKCAYALLKQHRPQFADALDV